MKKRINIILIISIKGIKKSKANYKKIKRVAFKIKKLQKNVCACDYSGYANFLNFIPKTSKLFYSTRGKSEQYCNVLSLVKEEQIQVV